MGDALVLSAILGKPFRIRERCHGVVLPASHAAAYPTSCVRSFVAQECFAHTVAVFSNQISKHFAIPHRPHRLYYYTNIRYASRKR